MQAVAEVVPAPIIGAQTFIVVLACGHEVIRKPPIPKQVAWCNECLPPSGVWRG